MVHSVPYSLNLSVLAVHFAFLLYFVPGTCSTSSARQYAPKTQGWDWTPWPAVSVASDTSQKNGTRVLLGLPFIWNQYSVISHINMIYDMMWHDMRHVTCYKWRDVTWRDVTWCDVMWCDVVWCVTVRYDTIGYMIYVMICYDIWYDIRYNMIRYDTIRCDMIWYDMIWYDMIWYDMIWYDIWHDMTYDIRYDIIWYVYCNWVSTQRQWSAN